MGERGIGGGGVSVEAEESARKALPEGDVVFLSVA